MRAEHRRLLHGERVDVVARDVCDVDPRRCRQQSQHQGPRRVGRVRMACAAGIVAGPARGRTRARPHQCFEADDRLRVALPVEGQALVRLPVQVDRQLRDARDGSGLCQHGGAVREHEAPGEAELAVQPRVQQRAAVDLHPGLQSTGGRDVRLGLELEARRVRVRTHDVEGERRARGRGGVRTRTRDREREDRTVPDHDVPTAGFQCPRLVLVELREARVHQSFPHRVRRVERGRRLHHECGQVRRQRRVYRRGRSRIAPAHRPGRSAIGHVTLRS